MIKKAKKLWSKKLKAAIISLSLGLAVALSGAVAAISISANNNKNLGGTLADGVVNENVAYTFKKGGTAPSGSVTYKTQEEAWNAAVQYSVDSGKKVGFDLTEDWVAQPYNTQIVTERVFYNITMVAPQTIPSTTVFGNLSGVGIHFGGALQVPYGANIVLNMGEYNIDRNLDEAVAFGGVIYVEGTLSIYANTDFDDSEGKRSADFIDVSGLKASKGLITGGYLKTACWAAGITVYGGTVNMYGGAVYNNRVAMDYELSGHGVNVTSYWDISPYYDVNTLQYTVVYNTAAANYDKAKHEAAIAASKATIRKGVFNFHGGFVSYNYATTSGTVDGGGFGVNHYAELNMWEGATISWNTAFVKNGQTGCFGGGVNNWCGTMNMYGGEVKYNTSGGVGGGLCAYGRVGILNEPALGHLTIYKGRITNNYSYGHREGGVETGGGGIGTQDSVTILNGDATDGIIIQNNATYKYGGGLYARDGAFVYGGQTLISGKVIIDGNLAYQMSDDPVASNAFVGYDAEPFTIASGFEEGYEPVARPKTADGDAGNVSEVRPIYAKLYSGSHIGILVLKDEITGELRNDGTFTRGYPKANSTVPISNYFFCGNAGYRLTGALGFEGKLVPNDDNEDIWLSAVSLSMETHSAVSANLAKDWSSSAAGNFGTYDSIGFGTVSGQTGRSNLFVPKGASVNLNLSGYNILRNLNSAINDGYIIRVEGELLISGEGLLSGGKNLGNGGAVFVAKGGKLTINGGTFQGNSSDGFGGAIYVEEGGTLNIRGGKIGYEQSDVTQNANIAGQDGGGIYLSSNSTITMSGAPVIANNISKINYFDNLYLSSLVKINIASAMTAGNVGITLANGKGEFTFGESAQATCFTADNDISYKVIDANGICSIVQNEKSLALRWSETVERSLNSGVSIRFDLSENWLADSNGNLNFDVTNTENIGFKDGAIFIPTGASIVLNLVGGNKIDRGLTGKAAVANGSVIIAQGKLLLKGDGIITGGNNTGNGGGLLAESGSSVIIQGGTFSGNSASNGGGISVGSGATLVMQGTEIKVINNHADGLGGGVYFAKSGTLNGKIIINQNTVGADGKAGNLYATDGITVGNLSGSQIGISATDSCVFTHGLKASELADVLAVFSSDTDSQVVGISGGEGYIGTKTEEPEGAFTEITYDKQKHDAVLDKTDIADL